MLLELFANGADWMMEFAKWLSFSGKFAIAGNYNNTLIQTNAINNLFIY